MPQRLVQFRVRRDLATAIGFDVSDEHKWRGGNLIEQYNLAPGRYVWVLHRLHENQELIETVRWGYEPPGDVTRMHTMVGIDFGMKEQYFRHMWRLGRVIVPLDGWFEFPRGGQEAWHIRMRSSHTMLAAAVTNFRPYTPTRPGTGFCLVTAGQPGLADPKDVRPAILTPEAARAWVSAGTSSEDAANLLTTKAVATSAFHTYQVGRAALSPNVNDARILNPVARSPDD